jgi:cytochrome P450
MPVLGRVVMLADPGAIRALYSSDAPTLAGAPRAFALRDFTDRGVLLLDGDEHRHRRRALHPALHGAALRDNEDAIAATVAALVAAWRPGDKVHIRDFAATVTTEVIARVLLGSDDPATTGRVASLYRAAGACWGVGMFMPDRAKSERIPGPGRRIARTMRELGELLGAEVRRRRANDSDRAEDVCSLLAGARDQDGAGLSEAEIREELLMLGIGGSFTTGITLQWAFDQVLHDPALHARLEAAPDDAELCDRVIDETLRLRTPQDTALRLLTDEMELAGVRIPAGELVWPSIYLVHRRADLYERPYAFDPDRFIGRRPSPFGWLPFGGGAHRCLGASLAQLEMRIVLREVFRRWRLRPVRPHVSRARRSGIFWVPAGGVPVTVLASRGAQPSPSRGNGSSPARACPFR